MVEPERYTGVVYLSSQYCHACADMDAFLEKLNPKVPVKRLDIDRDVKLIEQYQVDAVPTLICFEAGKEVKRLVGFSRQKVKEFLKNPLKD